MQKKCSITKNQKSVATKIIILVLFHSFHQDFEKTFMNHFLET